MTRYSLQVDGNTIKFYCGDEKIVRQIQEYIERFIESENWRNIICKTQYMERL